MFLDPQYSQLLSSTDFTHKKEIFNALLISGNTFPISGCHFPQCSNNRFLKSYEIHFISNFINRYIKWKCSLVSNHSHWLSILIWLIKYEIIMQGQHHAVSRHVCMYNTISCECLLHKTSPACRKGSYVLASFFY